MTAVLLEFGFHKELIKLKKLCRNIRQKQIEKLDFYSDLY